MAATSDIWVQFFFSELRCVALRFFFPAPSSCLEILLCMCSCGSERIAFIVEDYEEMETWRNVKRGQYIKLQLMRNARVISLAYLHRCGLCRKDVTRNLHPSGEFQNSCFFGFWGKETCSFSFYFCYPPFEIGLQLQEGWEVPKFSLKSRLPTSETLIVSERGFTHVWRGIGLFEALSWSHQFRWQSVSLQGIDFGIRCWQYSAWVKKT